MMTRAAVEAGVLLQQPVQAGDADVVEPIDRIPHDFGRDGRFFRHRQVGGAGGGDQDRSAAARRLVAIEGDAPGQFVKHGPRAARSRTASKASAVVRVTRRLCPAATIRAAIAATWDGVLPWPKIDFRESLAGVAVVIDPGEAQILVRLLAQNLKELLLRRLRSNDAGADGLEEGAQLLTVHRRVDFGPT